MKKCNIWMVIVLMTAVAMTTSCSRFRRAGRTGSAGGVSDVGPVPGVVADDVSMEGDRFTGEEVRGQFDVVYFDYDSSQVKVSEQAKVERVAEAMRQDSAMQIIVEGHSDERGSAEYNLALGERRALAIRAFLVGCNIDASRIQTRSFGEEKPAVQGSSDDAWRQNRRGEFVVVH